VQGELSSEYESHTRNELKPSLTSTGAVSLNNRAYCDLCEQFGHEEADCPSAQDAQPTVNSNNNNDDEEF
jgi:hypothetical protein